MNRRHLCESTRALLRAATSRRAALRCAALLFGLVAWFSVGEAHAFTATRYSGINPANLYRTEFTLNAGQSVTWDGTTCTGDPVMLVVEGYTTQTGTRTHSYVNDDFSGVCPKLTVTNTGGSTRTFTLLIGAYYGNGGTITVKKNGVNFLTNQTFGGWVYITQPSIGVPAHYRVQPRRAASGGGVDVDTILYTITLPNESPLPSYMDDDSHLRLLPAIDITNNSGPTTTYYMAVGFYSTSPGATGQVDLWAWDNSAIDPEGDGIPNDIETSYGTNQAMVDTDQDGIWDYAEVAGVPSGSLIGFDSSLIMPWQAGNGGTADANPGSDPLVQDLFIEAEYMQKTSGVDAHDHDLRVSGNWTTFYTDLRQNFQNDSAWTGRTIRPHVQFSNAFSEVDGSGNSKKYITLGTCSNSNTYRFYELKNNSFYFDPLRSTIFHYMVMAHSIRVDGSCVATTNSGWAEIDGNDFVVTLGDWSNQKGTVAEQKGTFVHELGHNLNLTHNGNDQGSYSCVHASVMNYRYQTSGVNGVSGGRPFGYSRGVGDLCENGFDTCGVTCAVVSGKDCVPSNRTSPKTGCNPNYSGCDCDEAEWSNLLLNFVKEPDDLTVYNPGAALGRRDVAAVRQHAAFWGPLLRGDRSQYTPAHERILALRKQALIDRGLVEGRDFFISSATGRAYTY